MLNLAVQSALDELKPEISILRQGIRALRISPLMLDRLEALCTFTGVKFLKPILDVPTRWNSTYDMLTRALELQKPLQIIFLELNGNRGADDETYLLDTSDWDKFGDITKFLAPFKEASEAASSDKYPSLSVVVPLYNSLLDHVKSYLEENTCDNSNDFESAMFHAAENCSKVLLRYYDTTSDACTIATVLDPRLKVEYYQMTEGENQETVASIKKIVADAYCSYVPNSLRNTETLPPPLKNQSILGSIYKKRKVLSSVELEEYLNQSTVSMNVKPLDWWKANEEQFPNLAKMARDYLAIPGTSASSERLFSSGRQLITDFRCSLNPQTIQACMCLKNWLD